jgi:hypothetical protein
VQRPITFATDPRLDWNIAELTDTPGQRAAVLRRYKSFVATLENEAAISGGTHTRCDQAIDDWASALERSPPELHTLDDGVIMQTLSSLVEVGDELSSRQKGKLVEDCLQRLGAPR